MLDELWNDRNAQYIPLKIKRQHLQLFWFEVDPVLPRHPAPPEPEVQSLDRKKKLLNRYRNQSGADPVPDQKTKVFTGFVNRIS